MQIMFFKAKKSANTLFKLCYEYRNVAHFQISPAHKACLNPLKTLARKPKELGLWGTFSIRWNKNVCCRAILIQRLSTLSEGGIKTEEGMEGLQEILDFEGVKESEIRFKKIKDEDSVRNVGKITSILKQFESLSPEARSALEKSGVRATSDLVQQVLFRFRNHWKYAFTCFLWAGSQPDYNHKLDEYHLMISILGRLKRFNIAWGLIKEMHDGGKDGRSMVTFQTMLIMMRSYSAVHDAGRAVRTFYAMEEYNLKVDARAFQSLLDALCRHNNVRFAEQMLYDKKDVFGCRSCFNIVLNGWCNIVMDVVEAKRFWKVMAHNRINPDADSYNSMICCLSKTGSLRDVTRLFDEMKRRKCAPDVRIYNCLVYSLARENCVRDAFKLLNLMVEKGFPPNAVTYNCLIVPLCESERLEDAYMAFEEMIQKGYAPSIEIFHAFFVAVKDPKETLTLFKKMVEGNCAPTIETFIILIRKFCCWHEFENVFKLWNDMAEHGLGPDCGAYIVLIHELFLNGKPEEAYKYYEEMKAKGFSPETNIDKMMSTWIAGRESAAPQLLKLKEKKTEENLESSKTEYTGKNRMPWWKKDRRLKWR